MFSRGTVLEACVLLGVVCEGSEFSAWLLRWELDAIDTEGFRLDGQRAHSLSLFRTWRGDQLDTLARQIVEGALETWRTKSWGGDRETDQQAQRLLRTLSKDGYVYNEANGKLCRQLPSLADTGDVEDEVQELLTKHGFSVTEAHLGQAIKNHTAGNWAAANSQSRTFLEALLDEVAYKLVPGVTTAQNQGEARRQALVSQCSPPFLSEMAREWSSDGKDLIHGVFKHLHTQGSHPGVSNEDDSTSRLQLVLILARRLLRRFDSRA